MVYQPSRLVTSLFTIFIMIKVNGLERKPFVKTGIFMFASIKTNTRMDNNYNNVSIFIQECPI